MAKTLSKRQLNREIARLKAKLIGQGLKPERLPADAHFEIAAQSGAELIEDVSRRAHNRKVFIHKDTATGQPTGQITVLNTIGSMHFQEHEDGDWQEIDTQLVLTVNEQVGADADDGYRFTGTDGFGTTKDPCSVGYWDVSAGLNMHQFFRWTGVAIAGDITAAAIEVHSPGAGSGAPQMKVYGVDEDNPPAPTSAAEFDADPLTSAAVDWDETFGTDWYTSPSLIAIFQELVDSYTISNDAIMVQVKNDGGTAERWNNIDDYGGGAENAAKLSITFTPPSATDSQPAFIHGHAAAGSSKTAYTRGLASTSSSKAAYLGGTPFYGSDSQAAYLRGLDSATGSKAGYARGLAAASDSQAAYAFGHLIASDSKAAHTRCWDVASDSKAAYTKCIVSTSNTKGAFLRGPIAAPFQQPLVEVGPVRIPLYPSGGAYVGPDEPAKPIAGMWWVDTS